MIPLLAGLAVVSAGLAARQSRHGNQAVRNSLESARRAAGVQIAQLRSSAKEAKARNVRNQQIMLGQIRVAAAESGTGFGGSWADIERQALHDAQYNSEIIDINAQSAIDNVLSGFEASRVSLESQITNPIIAGFTGGLQGLMTGLAITSQLGDLSGEGGGEGGQARKSQGLNIGGAGGAASYRPNVGFA